MSRRTVTITRHSPADVRSVWKLLSEAERWKDWGAFTVARRERDGAPDPDGVGAIRNFGFPGYVSREEVVEFDPPVHLAYTMLKGLPLRDYRADVTLTQTDRGTTITWVSSYDGPAFWSPVLKAILGDLARRLAKRA